MRWTRKNIVAEIRELHSRGVELNYATAEAENLNLVRAAAWHFGTWRRAVEAAGIAYESICKYRRWTRERIVARIRELNDEKADLSWRSISTEVDPPLAAAALRPNGFRTWREAIAAAGLNIDEVARYQCWTEERVLREIKALKRQKAALSSKAVQSSNQPLFCAARRRFGSWDEALAQAGLSADRIRLRRPSGQTGGKALKTAVAALTRDPAAARAAAKASGSNGGVAKTAATRTAKAAGRNGVAPATERGTAKSPAQKTVLASTRAVKVAAAKGEQKPAKAVPAKTARAKVTPAKTVAAKAAPVKAAPGKATSAKAAPARNAAKPAQGPQLKSRARRRSPEAQLSFDLAVPVAEKKKTGRAATAKAAVTRAPAAKAPGVKAAAGKAAAVKATAPGRAAQPRERAIAARPAGRQAAPKAAAAKTVSAKTASAKANAATAAPRKAGSAKKAAPAGKKPLPAASGRRK